MIVLMLSDELEAQIIGDQVFLYSEGDSDVLNIPGIEDSQDTENILRREIELLNNSAFTKTIALFN